MPSSHLILCLSLLLLPSIFPSIRVFSNESTLPMRWPKYWRFSFIISPSKEHPGLIFRMVGWISLQSKGLSRVFSNTTVQKHQFSLPIWGGRREEGSGWGTPVYLWRIHVDIWQNQYNIIKLKNNKKIKRIQLPKNPSSLIITIKPVKRKYVVFTGLNKE